MWEAALEAKHEAMREEIRFYLGQLDAMRTQLQMQKESNVAQGQVARQQLEREL